MSLSNLPTGPGWVLHVHAHLRCTSTLVYEFNSGVTCKLSLTGAYSSLLLALAVARMIDLQDGFTERAGYRSLKQIGKLVSVMPGAGNPVEGSTIGGYKRNLARRLRETDGRLPKLINQEGYGLGYGLGDARLTVTGIDLENLILAARN